MANQYLDRIQNPASTDIKEKQYKTIQTQLPFGSVMGNNRVPTSASWTPELDRKYGTNLMAEEGIDRTDAASIIRNIAGQYGDAVRQNAPVVQGNANIRRESMRGLIGMAQASAQAQRYNEQYQPEPRAQLRQRRESVNRFQSRRHQVGE